MLAESAVNRRLLPELLYMLGDDFATPARHTLASLRSGQPTSGSGILVL